MQYEMPYSYIQRVTAASDAFHNMQRATSAANRAAKRLRVAHARAEREKLDAPKKSLTWRKTAPGTFVSSKGGWTIIHHDDNGVAGFELLRKGETIDFFDTLGGAKKRVKGYRNENR